MAGSHRPSRSSSHLSGRHFLQIPGPTNVPDRVLRAIDNPTMDHRGPGFGEMGLEILTNLRQVFQTEGPVVIYPASGTGAWEAALTNTLSPGDTVLMCRTGWFATLWKDMADRLQLHPIFLDTDWRRGADVPALAQALGEDTSHRIKAVCVVHNETSTGCTSRIDEVRAAMDAAGHPALLLVDTISSLASIDYRHDAWGVDVTVAGSQKGLMLPPGLSFNAISPRALAATEAAKLPRSYWDWRPMLEASLTAVRVPDGHSADALRAAILSRFNMSLGNGLGILKDRVFRIGHLGDFGDLQLLGTLGGVEMGLRVAGVPHRPGGTQAAIDYLSGNA